MHSTLSALRAFFLWLAAKPGYKSRIAYADAEYFNLGDKDVRIAKAVPVLHGLHSHQQTDVARWCIGICTRTRPRHRSVVSQDLWPAHGIAQARWHNGHRELTQTDRRLSDAIKQRYPTHVVLSEERDRIYRGQEWSWVY